MPLIQINMKVYGPVPSDLALSKREWNRLKKLAWEEVGKIRHAKLRPKHFTKAGAREYDYKPRSGEAGSGHGFRQSYTDRKLKRWGHTDPLVWSGETRELSSRGNIAATGNGVRLTYPSLRKLNQFKPKSKSGIEIDMIEEFQTVSQEEREIIAQLWIVQMERFLRSYRGGGSRSFG